MFFTRTHGGTGVTQGTVETQEQRRVLSAYWEQAAVGLWNREDGSPNSQKNFWVHRYLLLTVSFKAAFPGGCQRVSGQGLCDHNQANSSSLCEIINKPHSPGPDVQTEGDSPPTIGAAIAFAAILSVTTIFSRSKVIASPQCFHSLLCREKIKNTKSSENATHCPGGHGIGHTRSAKWI